jgi:hypothetical protein
MGQEQDAQDRHDKVDNHGRPAMIIDAKGYIHLAFGGHGAITTAGDAIKVTLENPDILPDNYVLVKPGRIKSLGQLADLMVAYYNKVASMRYTHGDLKQ